MEEYIVLQAGLLDLPKAITLSIKKNKRNILKRFFAISSSIIGKDGKWIYDISVLFRDLISDTMKEYSKLVSKKKSKAKERIEKTVPKIDSNSTQIDNDATDTVTEEIVDTASKKRGRPRLNKPVVIKVPGKRGRPRKPAPLFKPVPRKRGRPRKE